MKPVLGPAQIHPTIPVRHRPQTPGRNRRPAIGGTGAYKKAPIPKALREAVWLKQFGKQFEAKCPVLWCQNRITAYDFQAGHNVPECKGGATVLDNLVPICSRCNLSMGSQYSIDEWNRLGTAATRSWHRWFTRLFSCFALGPKATPVHPSSAPPSKRTKPSK